MVPGTVARAGCCLLVLPGLCMAAAHNRTQAREVTPVVIHAGTLLVRADRAPSKDQTLLIRDGRIGRIETGLKSPAEMGEEKAELVDLSQSFVMAGLMDAHVHVMAQPSAFIRRAGTTPQVTASELAVNTVIFTQRTLAAGFTTVRDVGSNTESVLAVRDAINAGLLLGPRIFVSGPPLSATGGHGDAGFSASESMDPDERLSNGVCDGPDECSRAVRYLHKMGVDFIKIAVTGGFLSNTGTEQQLYPDEIEAVVRTARQLDMKVAAHAYAPGAIVQALEAGVNSIEHGWLMDDEGVRLLKNKGAYLVPTLLISRPTPWTRFGGTAKAAGLRDEAQAFEKAYAAGAPIAFGTDVGMFDHGQNALELATMVQLGMSEPDALFSATVATARLFGIEDEAGSLEVGKRADIIAMSQNPLEDIGATRKVNFVMQGGRIFKRQGSLANPVRVRPVGEAVAF